MMYKSFRSLSFLLFFSFLFLCCNSEDSVTNPKEKKEIKTSVNIKFLGHSSFLITTPDSLSIITDPFGNTVSFLKWNDTTSADIVTVSHSHADHNQSGLIKGNPIILKDGKTDTIGTVKITAFETQHGKLGTQVMGNNWIYIFRIGELKIVHLGETGSFDNPEIINAVRGADVLLVPVGQVASVSFEEIKKLADTTGANIIIPHHFSPNKQQLYHNSSTLAEFEDYIRPEIKISYMDFLNVSSKMEKQVVVLKAMFSR